MKQYDSVTVMNDTCFGPLWDMAPIYDNYESNPNVDFWGMTNHQGIKAGDIYIHEHLQSYFISFKKRDRKSTRLNSSHIEESRMPSSA